MRDVNISARIFFNEEDQLNVDIWGQLVTIFTVFDVMMIYIIMCFLAVVKDIKWNIECQPAFLPKRPPRGFRLYAVLLETGASPAGGTTSRVFLRMCGKLTTSPAFTLTCTSEDRKGGSRRLFGSNNKDLFIVALPHYLGSIEAFEVVNDRRGECPPWFLRSIRVMCLDNRKCWKSRVGAWLRGDKTPYRIRADMIGALSTRNYLVKVIQQNHNWLFPWYRALGSSFTSFQRVVIHWTATNAALTIAHLMSYNPEKLFNITEGKVATPIFNANHVVAAGLAAASGGVLTGAVMRIAARLAAGGTKWTRVDDKDDFAHLMEGLQYADGAVVRAPVVNEDCDARYRLTPRQIRVLHEITRCREASCHGKDMLNRPECPPDKSCAFRTEREIVPTSSESEAPAEVVEEKAEQNKEAEASGGSETESSASPPEQDHGYRYSIQVGMKDLWNKAMGGIAMDEPSESQDSANDVEQTNSNAPLPSQRLRKFSARKPHKTRKVQKLNNVIPSVSARVDSSTSLESRVSGGERSNLDGEGSKSGGDASNKSDQRVTHEYDSLSEGESDQEITTRSAKTEAELDLIRRPAEVYETAPNWDDQFKVWVQNTVGGDVHHKALLERYDCTIFPAGCCFSKNQETFITGAIKNYVNEEEHAPPGQVLFSGLPTMLASLVALSGLVLSIGGVGFAIYQRLFLPNSDSLIFLYIVLLVLVLQPILSTADAATWAFAATWARRRRVLQARKDIAKMLYDDGCTATTEPSI